MVLSVKNAGSWATVKDLYVKQGGVWVPVQKAFVRSAGVWVEYFAAEVVAIVGASVNDLDVSSLFSPDDWASTKKKRVIIDPGVIVGATSTAAAALLTGTGRGGLLFIENGGDIRGAGGTVNGGAGGAAIDVQQAGLTLDNSGFIRGGGGGGGKGGTGGTGGQGRYTAYSHQAWPGDTNYDWSVVNSNCYVKWAGGYVVNAAPSATTTSFNIGGTIYYRGARYSGGAVNSANVQYRVSRDVPYFVYTNGGAGGVGGDGGAGLGHDQANAAGAAGANGAAGGTNAGAGGTGGAGGAGSTWGTAGVAGSAGSNGAAGNYTGGVAGAAGAAGGAAGAAITGLARTLINTGTIQGAT